MKLGIYSFGGCEGCRYRLADLLLSLSNELGIEIVYEPLIGLSEERDEYDVVLVEGSVASKEDIEKLREIRRKAKILIALGSCATLGGIPGLRRFTDEGFVKSVYGGVELPKTPVNPAPLSKYVKVDYWIRGCPPTHEDFRRILYLVARTSWFRQGERRLDFCRESIFNLEGRAITLQGDKCIVCGRCVKVCGDMGINAIDMAYRSIETMVVTPFKARLDDSSCISCGQCTLFCPVGAITETNDLPKVQDMLREGIVSDVYIEPESLAAICEYFNCSVETVVGGLKKLGFEKVVIWRPGHRLNNEKTAILPASEAEYLFIEKFYPQLANYLADPPKLKAEKAVLITQCTARKLSTGENVLTTREAIRMLAPLDLEAIDRSPPSEVLDERLEGLSVATGPSEVRRAMDNFINGRNSRIEIRICPGGCVHGGGQPFAKEGFSEGIEKRLREIISRFF